MSEKIEWNVRARPVWAATTLTEPHCYGCDAVMSAGYWEKINGEWRQWWFAPSAAHCSDTCRKRSWRRRQRERELEHH